MPYIPTPEQRQKNREYWQSQRGLSDDEIASLETGGAGDGSLSDDEIAQLEASGGGDDRSDDEKNAGYALNTLNTISFGFGDEIAAGTNSLLNNTKYDDELKKARRIQERYSKYEPWDSWGNIGSTGAGIVGSGPAAVSLYKAGSVPFQALRGAVGLAPKATSVVGKGTQTLANLAGAGALGTGVYEAGSAEGDIVDRAKAVNPSSLAIGAGAGLVLGPAGYGAVKLAQAGRNAMLPYERQAARYLAERLGTTTPDEFAAQQAAAAQGGKPAVLADVGPKGIQDTAGVVAREPGQGREIAQKVLTERQQGQVARVSEDVGNATGGNPGSFTQTSDDLAAARQKEAQPLYQQAFSNPKPVVSKKIVEIAGRPSGKTAIQRGLKIAADEGIPESELVIKDQAGNVIGYSAKGLHYAKLALDDMIESAIRSGDNSAARAYQIMKRELLGEMDTHIPGYAQARKVFAGHSANKSALEKGRQAVNAHPDQIKSEMAGLSQGEQEFYRRGYAQRIIEQVESSPDKGNAVNRIFGNTAKRDRLRAVLGDEEYNRLAERLGVEQKFYDTYANANVGSSTAERTAQSRDLEQSALGEYGPALVQTGMTGNVSYLVRVLGLGKIADMLRRIGQGRREAIAKMLFSRDPAQVKQAVEAIRREYVTMSQRQALEEMGSAIATTHPDAQTAGGVAGATAYQYSPYQPF